RPLVQSARRPRCFSKRRAFPCWQSGLCRTNSGTRPACLRTLEGEIMDLSVTPDGRRVVSGTSDKTVRLWDLESGSCLAIFQSGGGAIRSLAVFGQGLVLGSDFGLVEFVGMRGSLPSQAAYWLTLTRL